MRARANSTDTLRYDLRIGYTIEVDRDRAQEITAQLQDALQLIREHFLE